MSNQEDKWDLAVERGPECLLVKLSGKIVLFQGDLPLAEHLWLLMQRHFTCRIVLDLNEVERLTGYVVRQLKALARQVYDHKGMMRICGLSEYNRRLLCRYGLRDRLPAYENREEALIGPHGCCLPQVCGAATPSWHEQWDW